MPEFTPGPWSCQPIGDESDCNILGGGRELIATVADCDARLIAAAPDLLNACRDALHVIDASKGDNWTTVDDLREAIAKAEGRDEG